MKTPELLGQQNPEEISSLLLHLSDGQLLVPVETLVEIVGLQIPVAVYDSPAWMLGEISWRDQRLPLISYEVMRGGNQPTLKSNCRIAVIANAGDDSKLPFYAMVVQGTPRLVRVEESELVARTNPCQQGELVHVSVSGEDAVIPDLPMLEQACAEWRRGTVLS